LNRLLERYGAISGAICQSLSDHTFNHLVRAVLIINTKRNAVAVPEIKLCQIAAQMLLSTVLIDAFMPRLKFDSSLNRVGRDLTASVLLLAVIDRLVAVELLADAFVEAGLIRHEVAFAADVSPQDRHNLANRRVVDVEATGRTAALVKRAVDSSGFGATVSLEKSAWANA
jgi:hypothetical protein